MQTLPLGREKKISLQFGSQICLVSQYLRISSPFDRVAISQLDLKDFFGL